VDLHAQPLAAADLSMELEGCPYVAGFYIKNCLSLCTSSISSFMSDLFMPGLNVQPRDRDFGGYSISAQSQLGLVFCVSA
jgi:hypothetical protein